MFEVVFGMLRAGVLYIVGVLTEVAVLFTVGAPLTGIELAIAGHACWYAGHAFW